MTMRAIALVTDQPARRARVELVMCTVVLSMIALGCGSNGGSADAGIDSSPGQAPSVDASTAADAGTVADAGAAADVGAAADAGPPSADASADAPQDTSGPPPPAEVAGFALDDTGVTTCSTASAAGLPCNAVASGTDLFPRQDGESGRDRTAAGDADGRAGFSFRKLDTSGAPLVDQSLPYATLPWACLEDRVTGLTWEVKTTDGGLRDQKWRFTWYATGGRLRQGLSRGMPNGGTCADGTDCDTAAYAAAVNAAGLCGKHDWRVPERAELLSLVDYGAATAPLVDAAFLPDVAAEASWSATPNWTGSAWTVDFASGASRVERTEIAHTVRLVRGGY
jgi:hypothetical protein